MATRVIDDVKLQNIAVAIQSKDNGGQMTVDEMPTRIENIPTSGGVKTQKVNFYDFKGNLAHSYTAEEAAELTEMPEAPTIEGFTFQKWNRSLASVKLWLTKHENDNCDLNVGGLYVTTDGHTRIYMHLREAELANLEMPFCIQQMAGTVTIDWGDGSTPETITAAGIYSHVWQVDQYPADVVIDIEYTPSGSTKLILGRDQLNVGLFNAESYYAGCVTAIHFGSNIDIRNASVGRNCRDLTEVNLPDGITSIGGYAFYGCTNLALTVLPDGITSIGGSAFYGCTNLALTVLPDGITSIASNAFNSCTNLALTALTDGITSIGISAFQNCTNLALTVLPDGITSIGISAFSGCTNLALTVLPDGITSISQTAFSGCTNLALTALPDGVTSISGYAFSGCTSLYIIDLTAFTDPQSIPTLANTNAFQNIPTQAQFWVANQEMYDAFTTATNWSTYASKFVIKEAA